jgi:putative DNA primase/helicase
MTTEQLSVVPAALVVEPRWIAWRYEERTDKHGRVKMTKVPYRGDGRGKASSTDPSTWTSFDRATDAVALNGFDGAGFVLGDGYAGVDLDGCRHPTTGAVHPEAFKVIAKLDSYTEISPSGCGLKVFVRGTLPEGRRAFADVKWKGYLAGVVPSEQEKYEVAMFATSKYFTVTGAHLSFTPADVRERTAELADLHASVFPAEPATNGAHPHDPTPVDLDDAALVEKAMAAGNGPKFKALWFGDIGGYPSPSEADQALCNLLAFWCGGDAGRIDALFRESGLMRDKWEQRADYRKRTIARALASCTEFYSPHAGRDEYRGPQAAQPEGQPMPDDDAGADTRTRRTGQAALRILTDTEMEQQPTPTGIIEGVVTEGSHVALVGPPGCGKGLIALDMLCSLALRWPWQGIPTHGGTCVYLAAEKARLNGPRLLAWKGYHGVEGSIPIRFLPDHISLLEGAGHQLVIDALNRVQDQLGEPVVALTIDTLAKTILPGDENKTAEMGAYLLNIQRIREATGCAVLTQHHMNAGAERERGNTSLRGDVDLMIFAKNEDGLVRLNCEKSNADEFDPINLRVHVHSPAALIVTATEAWQWSRQELSPNERQALESLPRDFFDDGASASRWEQASGVPQRSFYRVTKSLVSKGYAMRVVSGRSARYKITESGRDAITATAK